MSVQAAMNYLDRLANGEISSVNAQDIAGHLDLALLLIQAQETGYEFSDEDLRRAFIQRRRLTLFASTSK